MWSRKVSADGAHVYNTDRYPTPDGGVLVVMREKKLVGGVQTDEQVLTLLKLNASGTSVWSRTLPNEDSSGDIYDTTYWAVADTGGRLAVVRQGRFATSRLGKFENGVSVGLFDGEGKVTYDKVLHGNLDVSEGLTTGYLPQGIAIGVDTLFLKATMCTDDLCDVNGRTKLYPIQVTGMRTDSPRGTVLYAGTGTQPPPQTYVALGDSFSSGEGVPPFLDDGTQCHRASQAYPRLLGNNPSISLQLAPVYDTFRSCSGAETTHVLNGWNDDDHSEPPQVDALVSSDPKIVTITIGGNDIDFKEFATACVVISCNFSSAAYANSRGKIDTVLANSLETTYKELLRVTRASGTKIYVLSYPQVIRWKSSSAPFDPRCLYMYDGPNSTGYWEEARAANDLVSRLNLKISQTIEKVRGLAPDNLRLDFISATRPGSPFAGHEMCSSGESYFQNVDETSGGFHPNAKGQGAYAQLVRTAIGE